MVILKGLDAASGWFIWHKDLSQESYYLYLNGNFSESDLTQDTRIWGQQSFTDSVISMRSNYTTVLNQDYIAYCFHSVDEYQKVGTYSSTGATGIGNQITTGFRPRFLLVKSYSTPEDWYIFDSERINLSGSNDGLLFANTPAIENTGFARLEFTDTGWYWETAYGGNSSGYDYIYLAIA